MLYAFKHYGDSHDLRPVLVRLGRTGEIVHLSCPGRHRVRVTTHIRHLERVAPSETLMDPKGWYLADAGNAKARVPNMTEAIAAHTLKSTLRSLCERTGSVCAYDPTTP